jgi:hypothetical protein
MASVAEILLLSAHYLKGQLVCKCFDYLQAKHTRFVLHLQLPSWLVLKYLGIGRCLA